MASRLAEAHIEAERRLRLATVLGVAAIWQSLPSWDRVNVAQWLVRVVPFIRGALRFSVSLTDAYLGRAMDRAPLGIDPDEVMDGLRNGTPLEEVYHRPFVTMWSSLDAGNQWQDAFDAGLARAKGAAAMDVQLAMRATAEAVDEADPKMFGFRRAIDADPCDYCRAINGAYVKSAAAMPLHNHCGCSLEPLTEPHKLAVFLPDGTRIRNERGGPLISTPPPETVAIHEHGELGALLGSAEHDFTTEAQALGH